jgi:hypothetical protein
MSKLRLYALVSAQGTACAETVIRSDEDTPELRAIIEKRHCLNRPGWDDPIPGSWTEVTDNDAFADQL